MLPHEREMSEKILFLKSEVTAASAEKDPTKEAVALHALSFTLGVEGESDEAVRAARGELRLRRTIGDLTQIAEALSNLGLALHLAGHSKGAQFRYRQALDAYLRVGENVQTSLHYMILGSLYQEDGQYEEALKVYEAALPFAPSQDGTFRCWVQESISDVYKILGNLPVALHYQYEAMKELRLHGGENADSWLRLADFHLLTGESWNGLELLKVAEDGFRKEGQLDKADAVAKRIRDFAQSSKKKHLRLFGPDFKGRKC